MVSADASVLARVGAALVEVGLAAFAAVPREAVADELVDAVLAAAAVHARVGGALVHVAEAARVVVAAGTLAAVRVHQVHAHAAVGARVGRALVDVGLAVLAGKAGDALAGIPGKCNFVVHTKNRSLQWRIKVFCGPTLREMW